MFGVELKKEKVSRIKKLAALGKTPSSAITEEMVETIEKLPMPSLMEQPPQEPEQGPAPEAQSLMAPPPVEEEQV